MLWCRNPLQALAHVLVHLFVAEYGLGAGLQKKLIDEERAARAIRMKARLERLKVAISHPACGCLAACRPVRLLLTTHANATGNGGSSSF